jgi:endonuclease G
MKVDQYLIQALSLSQDIADENDAASGKPVGSTAAVVPILFQTRYENWSPFHSYPNTGIPDIKISSNLGNVFACLGSFATVEFLDKDPNITYIEASRCSSGLNTTKSLPFIKADLVHSLSNYSEKGDDAIVAIIDDGIDILHESFINSISETRLIAIWDQTDDTGPVPYELDYGTVYDVDDINGFIKRRNVPANLGRNEGGIPGSVMVGGHGTHVSSIAAGRATKFFNGGVAPNSQILFIRPALKTNPTDVFSLGYSKSHVDALYFIDMVAESMDMPVVVNVSQGMNAGAHDGTSLLEAAFDNFSKGGRKPGRVIVKSAGNERSFRGHMKIQIGSHSTDIIRWESTKQSALPDTVELWFESSDELEFRLTNPENESTNWISRKNSNEKSNFASGNGYELGFTRFHPDNGDSQLLVRVYRGSNLSVSKGMWELSIRSGNVNSTGIIHAWIERKDERNIEFYNRVDEDMTLSIPGTARSVISVGSIESSEPINLANYSSYGPTRDLRLKPELCAPGESIVGAKGGTDDEVCVKSGTSMAAPHVSGSIALLRVPRTSMRKYTVRKVSHRNYIISVSFLAAFQDE